MEQIGEWAAQRSVYITLKTLPPLCNTPSSAACLSHRLVDQLSLGQRHQSTDYINCLLRHKRPGDSNGKPRGLKCLSAGTPGY